MDLTIDEFNCACLIGNLKLIKKLLNDKQLDINKKKYI